MAKKKPFWTAKDHEEIEKIFKRAIRRNKGRIKGTCYRIFVEFNPIKKEGDFRLSLQADFA